MLLRRGITGISALSGRVHFSQRRADHFAEVLASWRSTKDSVRTLNIISNLIRSHNIPNSAADDLLYQRLVETVATKLDSMNSKEVYAVSLWLRSCKQYFTFPSLFEKPELQRLLAAVDRTAGNMQLSHLVTVYYNLSILGLTSTVVESQLLRSIANGDAEVFGSALEVVLRGMTGLYAEIPQRFIQALEMGLSKTKPEKLKHRILSKIMKKLVWKDYYGEMRCSHLLFDLIGQLVVKDIDAVPDEAMLEFLEAVQADKEGKFLQMKLMDALASTLARRKSPQWVARFLHVVEAQEKVCGYPLKVPIEMLLQIAPASKVLDSFVRRNCAFTEAELDSLRKSTGGPLAELYALKLAVSSKSQRVEEIAQGLQNLPGEIHHWDLSEVATAYTLARSVFRADNLLKVARSISDECIRTLDKWTQQQQWEEIARELQSPCDPEFTRHFLTALLNAQEVSAKPYLLRFLFLWYTTHPTKVAAVLRKIRSDVTSRMIVFVLNKEDARMTFTSLTACLRVLKAPVATEELCKVAGLFDGDSGNYQEFEDMIRDAQGFSPSNALKVVTATTASGNLVPESCLSVLKVRPLEQYRAPLLIAFAAAQCGGLREHSAIEELMDSNKECDFSTFRLPLRPSPELTECVATLHLLESTNHLYRKIQALLHTPNRPSFDVEAFIGQFRIVIARYSQVQLVQTFQATNCGIAEDPGLRAELNKLLEERISVQPKALTLNHILNLLQHCGTTMREVLIRELKERYSALGPEHKLWVFRALQCSSPEFANSILQEVLRNTSLFRNYGDDFLSAMHECNNHESDSSLHFAQRRLEAVLSSKAPTRVTRALPCWLRQGLIDPDMAASVLQQNAETLSEGAVLRQVLIKMFLRMEFASHETDFLTTNPIFTHPAIPNIATTNGDWLETLMFRPGLYVPLYDKQKEKGLWPHPKTVFLDDSRKALKGDYEFYREILRSRLPAFREVTVPLSEESLLLRLA